MNFYIQKLHTRGSGLLIARFLSPFDPLSPFLNAIGGTIASHVASGREGRAKILYFRPELRNLG
jgi:hypothetical protein